MLEHSEQNRKETCSGFLESPASDEGDWGEDIVGVVWVCACEVVGSKIAIRRDCVREGDLSRSVGSLGGG